MTENQLSKVVFDSGLEVHKALGSGLLESAYKECLYYELAKQGLQIEKQKALPLIYNEVKLEAGYRVDFLVENRLIVEIKSVDA